MTDTDDRLNLSRRAPALPLLWRDPQGLFARLAHSSPALGGHSGEITAGDFLGQALQLAERLPTRSYVLNLCDNPYLFTLGFCAALLCRQTTLLPQNRAPETLERLAREYPSSYVLHDGGSPDCAGQERVDLNQWQLAPATASSIPLVERDFPAAIAFTSGSTGTPKAIPKGWHTLVTSSLMNGACMLPAADAVLSQLSTVPPQHMWGLETGVLIPLFWPVCVSDRRPMFPQDISLALQALPAPRLLVTTPVHLRALLGSNLTLPAVVRTLCATAPLVPDLAVACETQTGGDLREIYGCSEIGSTAYRRTATESLWRLIPGLSFRARGGEFSVGGDHLLEDQALQDRVEVVDNGFNLLGRNEDMVNVGGKRGSLMAITQALLGVPGVADAAVFMPETTASTTGRPAALVVAEEKSVAVIQQHFSRQLDAIFLPRPLLFVDHLPRESTGKIHRSKLLELYREALNQPAKPSQ